MNECKQRIAIAEACGITGIRRVDEDPSCYDPGVLIDGSKTNVPNYLNDLNAMHDAVLSLSEDNQGLFRNHLADVVQSGSGFGKLGHSCVMSKPAYSDWFNATATQRAEAFLKTIGKWEEKE